MKNVRGLKSTWKMFIILNRKNRELFPLLFLCIKWLQQSEVDWSEARSLHPGVLPKPPTWMHWPVDLDHLLILSQVH